MIRTSYSTSRRLQWEVGALVLPVSAIVTAAALLLGIIILCGVSLLLGTTGIPVDSLVANQLTAAQSFAVWDVRLPRLLLGALAGWNLAMTGVMLQAISRNPIAEPGLLGLSQGAMLTILIVLIWVPNINLSLLPIAAILGGCAVALILIALVGKGTKTGIEILLMGIALDTVLSSINGVLLLYTPPETSYSVSAWLSGSLFQASEENLLSLLPWLLISVPAAVLVGRSLSRFELGEDMAAALGEPTRLTRPVILIVAVTMSSVAVSAVGPITFIGILAPHLVGRICPLSGQVRLWLSGLMGALLVIGADLMTRLLSADTPVPLGLSLIVIGVPIFLVMFRLRAHQVKHG
ncbi:MAG: FecCD family ABC transporter permease [Paraglaciecola chathamensis]